MITKDIIERGRGKFRLCRALSVGDARDARDDRNGCDARTIVTSGVRAPRDSGAAKAARLVKRLMLRCYKSRCAYLENTWWQEK